MPAYQIGYGCGTCGHVLRRQPGRHAASVTAAMIRDRPNTGLDGLDEDVIGPFSSRLPHGENLVKLLDIQPRLVTPGSADDYLAAEGPAAWRDEEPTPGPDSANVSYYRLGQCNVDERDQLFEFAVPMTDPITLDQVTATRYANAPQSTTAVAFGLLDIGGPWFRREQHWGLFLFLLDGHHKTKICYLEPLGCWVRLARCAAVLREELTLPR